MVNKKERKWLRNACQWFGRREYVVQVARVKRGLSWQSSQSTSPYHSHEACATLQSHQSTKGLHRKPANLQDYCDYHMDVLTGTHMCF